MEACTHSKICPNASRNLQKNFGAFIHFITISSKFDAKLLCIFVTANGVMYTFMFAHIAKRKTLILDRATKLKGATLYSRLTLSVIFLS